VTYVVPALAAGEYRLGCIVHPAMTASLIVR
jgi:plastocyanin